MNILTIDDERLALEELTALLFKRSRMHLSLVFAPPQKLLATSATTPHT